MVAWLVSSAHSQDKDRLLVLSTFPFFRQLKTPPLGMAFRVALPFQLSFSGKKLTDTPKEASSHRDSKSTQIDRINCHQGSTGL